MARMRPRLFGVRAPTQGMRTAVGNKFAHNPLEAAAPHGKYVWTARRHIVPLIIIAAMTANMLFAERVVAYTYLGNCDNRGTTTTWDATWYSTSGTTGVEMRQYQLPSKSSWATCTYVWTGFGHMDELDSLQGTGSQIVQLGIAKYVSSAGTSWLFVWTPSDNSGGIVVDAGGHFGAEPIDLPLLPILDLQLLRRSVLRVGVLHQRSDGRDDGLLDRWRWYLALVDGLSGGVARRPTTTTRWEPIPRRRRSEPMRCG